MTQLSPLESSALAQLPGIRHGYFTRAGGVSEGVYDSLNCGHGSEDARHSVAENRRRVADHLGVHATHLLSLYQIHGPDVVTVSEPWEPGTRPQADALVTSSPGIALGILAADCGPILFADPKARVVGAAHSGWRGALAGVMDQTVAAMEALGAKRADITAVLGPTIAQPSYEVGQEVRDAVADEHPGNDRFFAPSGRDGHFMFDLPGYIGSRLDRLGLAHAAALHEDTYADPARFFSYRRNTHEGEKRYGRLINAIVMTG